MLKENLLIVEEKVVQACARAGRNRDEVLLIAVSKTKPVEMIEEIYREGIRDFGENHPQEIREKFPQLPADVRWHMIGHLQTNKIKYIIERACMVHSVDSFHLAEAISKAAVKSNRVMPVLVEVNMAGEESKFGVAPQETEALIRQIAPLPGIRVEGLMTIAPYTDNPEDNRIYFREMKKLNVDIGAKNIDNVSMRHLSMGMTGDYEVAIEEGATMVRVGTGIFGARSYAV
ncbi:MAG: YggS family pyridoxal phosphate-dependent enzyme [Lachnospiraceae bacterium]|nr:YggS family pyridoxal phosphate-dependent enzyme [Lachnospiraceae bacterium]